MKDLLPDTVRYCMVGVWWCVCICMVASFLTSCSTAKYVECIARDNSRNPCQ